MSLTNVAELEQNIRRLFCAEEITASLQKHFILPIAFSVVLAIFAIVGNILILIALHKQRSLHPPSRLLLRSLAVSDLLVGIVAEPARVAYWISLENKSWNVCAYFFDVGHVTSVVLCNVTLSIVTAISVDRLLALLLGLRYRQVATVERVYVVVISLWIFSIFHVSFSFLNFEVWVIFELATISLCLGTSICCYTTIFLKLRRRQPRAFAVSIQERDNQTIELDLVPYRRAVFTALWVQFTLVVSYLPYILVAPFAYREVQMRRSSAFLLAEEIAIVFLYSSSSFNPILLYWRITELRQALNETLRQWFCHPNQ
ncbi:melanocortin receptor 5-like [Montipora capricornis]|uniref:melanocortin receptor 5-like n=1 Tax=Montipora capricornis TaxID=246305 RepID=UPI0035F1D6C3